MPSDHWTPFFFESNQFFDTIKDASGWDKLRAAYPHMSNDELLAAKEAYPHLPEAERDARPNYGLRMEHTGTRTLGDFFTRHGMQLSAPADLEVG